MVWRCRVGKKRRERNEFDRPVAQEDIRSATAIVNPLDMAVTKVTFFPMAQPHPVAFG